MEHGGNAEPRVDLFLAYPCSDTDRVDAVHDDLGSARLYGQQCAGDLQIQDGQRGAVPPAEIGSVPSIGDESCSGQEQIPVGVDHALGPTCGATRISQTGDLLIAAIGPWIQPWPGRYSPSPSGELLLVQSDDGHSGGSVQPFGNVLSGDQHPSLGVTQDVFLFGWRQSPIDSHEDCTEPHDGVEQHHDLCTVGQTYSNGLRGANSELEECSRCLIDCTVQLTVGKPLITANHSSVPWIIGEGDFESITYLSGNALHIGIAHWLFPRSINPRRDFT